MYHIATKRSTQLNISDIISQLSQNDTPEQLLVNELGVIFLDTTVIETERDLAEKILVDGLWSHNVDIQFISYCQLRRANGTASEYTHRAINQFRLNLANHRMIDIAKETLWL